MGDGGGSIGPEGRRKLGLGRKRGFERGVCFGREGDCEWMRIVRVEEKKSAALWEFGRALRLSLVPLLTMRMG
ncbi:hypothetical protein MA16_Dca003050 [Dendrobium catenatum]|uniref:Uncharacterized protein n=1 Tax=Dendrobium catenatum TaxID=906689 RepID=A0A2I0X9D1_9ASPA|nr:hypothetical protein MA16_Dca003050 [Dendrobium catenatum]